jgi:hypothetical protein
MPKYEYKGYQFESDHDLSEDEFATTLAHLDTLPPKAAAPVQPQVSAGDGEGFLDKAIGLGQAAASTITGGIGAATGWIPAAIQKANDPNNVNFEQQYAANMGAMTYEPSREKGQEYAGKVGGFVNDVLLPAATGVQGLPYANTAAPLLGAVGRNLGKFGKAKETSSPVKSLVETLKKEDEVPVAPQAQTLSTAELFKQKQAERARIQEIRDAQVRGDALAKDSAFTPEAEAQRALEEQQGLQQMGELKGALEGFDQLGVDQAATKRQAAAQELLNQRQTELELAVKRQASLDNNASLRQHQEAASAVSDLHARYTEQLRQVEEAKRNAAESARLAEESSKAAERKQMEIDDTQHVLPDTNEVIAPQYGAMQGVGRLDENGMPIRADLSMEARNLENPLQRNLWGDELGQKHPQENPTSLTASIDATPSQPWRGDLRDQQIGRLNPDHPYAGKIIEMNSGIPFKLEDIKRIVSDIKEMGKFVKGLIETGHTTFMKAAAKAKEILGSAWDGAKQMFKNAWDGSKQLDWASAKKAEGFSNIPGIKEKLRDIGNALIETPEKAIEFAKQTSDVAQNAVQSAFNNLTKGGTYLKGRLNNPIVHFGVDRFLKADGLAKADINQKLGQEYLGILRSLSKQEYADAFELLNVADLTKKTITPEMMQQHGLSQRLQDFITTHQKVMEDALANINRVREAAGKDPITAREAYSAMSMKGDYRKVVYQVDENGNRTIIGAIAADRLKGKLGWTLDKIEKHIQGKMPGVEFGPLRDTTLTRGSAKGTPHEAFTDALRTLGENNPHVAELLKVLDEVAKDDASNYMGMQKHTMQKKGIWGMEGRKPWETAENNATQFFENQVRYLESVYNWSHLAEAAKDVNSVIRNPDVMKKHPNAIRLTEEYMQNALGLNPSRLGRGIEEVAKAIGSSLGGSPAIVQKGFGTAKNVANTTMLALNESFLLIQALQAPTGIPAAVALLRSRGLASKWTHLTLGLDHFVEAGATLLKDQSGRKISELDRGAIEYAKKNHIYATDMVEHNSRTKADAGYYISRGLKAPAALIETGTRAQAFLTFVKVLEDGGMKVKDGLYEQAHRMTDQVMNNYSAMEKPPVYNALGPIGSMAYNLKSFGHNELSRWSEYAREIGKTGNPGPLLTQMATTIAVAGAFGLPMYSQFEALYDYITKKLGNPRSLTLDVIKTSEQLAEKLGPDGYEKFKHAMSHGLFSTLGADVSKRIGLGDVLPSKASDAAFAGGGKLADMATTAVKAAVNPDEQHLKAAAVAWSPNVLAGPFKEKWYTDEKGVYSMDPDKKRELITEINGTDRLLKTVGITGINESVKKTKDYQLKQLEKAYQDIRDNALVKISHDMAAGKGISQENIDKYFTNGQGDPSSFENSINDIGMKLNIPRDTLALMKGAASNSVQRSLATQRRVEAQ